MLPEHGFDKIQRVILHVARTRVHQKLKGQFLVVAKTLSCMIQAVQHQTEDAGLLDGVPHVLRLFVHLGVQVFAGQNEGCWAYCQSFSGLF